MADKNHPRFFQNKRARGVIALLAMTALPALAASPAPMYRATITFMLEVFDTAAVDYSGNRLFLENPKQAYEREAAVFKSAHTLRGVAERAKADGLALPDANALHISLANPQITKLTSCSAYTLVIRVDYTHPDADIAAKIAGYFFKEYEIYHSRQYLEGKVKVVEALKLRVDEQRKRVESLEKEMAKQPNSPPAFQASKDLEAARTQLNALIDEIGAFMSTITLGGEPYRIRVIERTDEKIAPAAATCKPSPAPMFRAMATVILSICDVNALDESGNRLFSDDPAKTYEREAEIFKSEYVLRRVVARAEKDALPALNPNLLDTSLDNAPTSARTLFIRVCYTHPDADIAAKMANYFSEAYIYFHLSLMPTAKLRAVEDLKVSIDAQRRRVEALEEETVKQAKPAPQTMKDLEAARALHSAMTKKLQEALSEIGPDGGSGSARILERADAKTAQQTR